MNTNKKLKLNTKKVIILSNEQQNAVQGGRLTSDCETLICLQTRKCTITSPMNGCLPHVTQDCFTQPPVCQIP